MNFIKFRVKDGILHVAPSEIAQIHEGTDGQGEVVLKNNATLKIQKVKALLAQLQDIDEPSIAPNDRRSLMEMIFG